MGSRPIGLLSSKSLDLVVKDWPTSFIQDRINPLLDLWLYWIRDHSDKGAYESSLLFVLLKTKDDATVLEGSFW